MLIYSLQIPIIGTQSARGSEFLSSKLSLNISNHACKVRFSVNSTFKPLAKFQGRVLEAWTVGLLIRDSLFVSKPMCSASTLLPAFPTKYWSKPDPQELHQPVITGGLFQGFSRRPSRGRCLHCHHQTHHARPMYCLFSHLGTPRNSNPIGSVAANELEP